MFVRFCHPKLSSFTPIFLEDLSKRKFSSRYWWTWRGRYSRTMNWWLGYELMWGRWKSPVYRICRVESRQASRMVLIETRTSLNPRSITTSLWRVATTGGIYRSPEASGHSNGCPVFWIALVIWPSLCWWMNSQVQWDRIRDDSGIFHDSRWVH